MLYLFVRDVSNRWQRYEKVFKLPKNYVIIFENQAKLMAWICWAVFKNVIQMLSKQLDYLSYFIDYQLIVFFDASLTKRSIVLYNSFFSFFWFIWQMEWRFCPCRAWLIASLSSGRCPGLCAAAPAGRRITICEYGGTSFALSLDKIGGTSTIKKLIKVAICNSYLCRLCIVFGLRYLLIR